MANDEPIPNEILDGPRLQDEFYEPVGSEKLAIGTALCRKDERNIIYRYDGHYFKLVGFLKSEITHLLTTRGSDNEWFFCKRRLELNALELSRDFLIVKGKQSCNISQ